MTTLIKTRAAVMVVLKEQAITYTVMKPVTRSGSKYLLLTEVTDGGITSELVEEGVLKFRLGNENFDEVVHFFRITLHS